MNFANKIHQHLPAKFLMSKKRIKRKKKVVTHLLPNGWVFKMRLLPLCKMEDGYMWLASLAVARSRRQVNDWLGERKKKSVARLANQLTGTFGNQVQAIAIRQVRTWIDQLPSGDFFYMRCESALPEKQFRVWQHWIKRHEKTEWFIDEKEKVFIFYKPHLYN